MKKYLSSSTFFDSENTDIQSFAQNAVVGKTSPKEKVLAIYYAVRDGWKYNASSISRDPEAFKASEVLKRTEGHCLDKATLMIACCRAVEIPARICLAKVRNHIAAEKMVALLGTDELVPHGYVEVFLNNNWVKATPAFNRELCNRLNVRPLDFDGENDSIFQEYDKEGGQFMEYLEEYGNFADLPISRMWELMKAHYPQYFQVKTA